MKTIKLLSCSIARSIRGAGITSNATRLLFLALLAASTGFAQTTAKVTITGINGYSDGVGVANGRWTGQPDRAPSWARPGKYAGFMAMESQNSNYWWDILGTNFSNAQGSVWLLDFYTMQPLSGISISVPSGGWTSNKIRIIPKCSYTFESYVPWAWLAVSRGSRVPSSPDNYAVYPVSLVGIIKSRGFGQCTWEVAYQRLKAGLSIPPSAYSTTGTINASYVPSQFDVLQWIPNGVKTHTGIITSRPQVTVERYLKTVGSTRRYAVRTTYSFTITERNADWKEARSTVTKTFVVDDGAVTTRIIGAASGLGSPTHYYR